MAANNSKLLPELDVTVKDFSRNQKTAWLLYLDKLTDWLWQDNEGAARWTLILLTCINELYMCLNFTPNPFCKAVYQSRTIFISFWYVCMRVIISIKSFTIGNFVEITIKPFKRS
jgi:hypothetical protein